MGTGGTPSLKPPAKKVFDSERKGISEETTAIEVTWVFASNGMPTAFILTGHSYAAIPLDVDEFKLKTKPHERLVLVS